MPRVRRTALSRSSGARARLPVFERRQRLHYPKYLRTIYRGAGESERIGTATLAGEIADLRSDRRPCRTISCRANDDDARARPRAPVRRRMAGEGFGDRRRGPGQAPMRDGFEGADVRRHRRGGVGPQVANRPLVRVLLVEYRVFCKGSYRASTLKEK